MTAVGKLWTGAVAYVSLLVGAGLSVAGNLEDTYRTRAGAVDGLDKVMAAGWPILVLLAIEMFVSPRWSSKRMFQAWRWLGCLAVGGMAMVVSWTHLHDLMASRGQLAIVAILGPLAIDGMAIMATGLILSTRVGHGQLDTVASGQGSDTLSSGLAAKSGATVASWTADLASGQTSATVAKPTRVSGLGWTSDTVASEAELAKAVDIPWEAELAKFDDWAAGHDRAIERAGQDIAASAELLANGAGPLPRRTTPVMSGVPDEARALLRAWDGQTHSGPRVDELLAAHFEVSERTARRWRTAVFGPASSPPAS